MFILGTLYILTLETVLDFFLYAWLPLEVHLVIFPLLLKYVFSVKK